jgi:uncharacterized membrane protein YbhN (UPF0104 family)
MSRWIVRAVVSLVVLTVLVLVMPLDGVAEAMGRVSPWVWTASLALFLAGNVANALKLQRLLGGAAPPRRVMIQAQYAGLAANLALPGLAGGDLVRAGYLAPAAGLGRVALASLADRLIDTATLVGLIAIALPFAGLPAGAPAIVQSSLWWVVVFVPAAGLAAAVASRLLRGTRIGQAVAHAWRELPVRRSSLLVVLGISAGVQSLFVLTNVWLARQAGVEASLAAWFVAWPLSKLIAVLPISLGGLGVREAALVSLLAPYGADGTAVLASGLLWQAVLAVSGVTGLAVTQVLRRREKTGALFRQPDRGDLPRTASPSSSSKSR